jgi:hypothetical protein
MSWNDPFASWLLICLVAAHALGDFCLQTRRDVENKKRWGTLLRHSLLHAGLAYVLAGAWTNPVLPLGVLLSHAAIDAIKARIENSGARAFLLDQAAHFAALVAIALWCARDQARVFWLDLFGERYLEALIFLSGAILTIYAGGYLIGVAVKPYLTELEATTDEEENGTKSRGFATGGQTIGRLERALILLFVLTSNSAGVGFLIAAKSIFRFGELKDPAHRMEAEYIIIGTLMSFGWGMLLAYVTRVLLQMSWVP